MLNRFGLKTILLVIVGLFLLGSLLYVLQGAPSLEEKQAELQRSTVRVSEQITKLEDLVEEWKNLWQSVAMGNTSFADGANRLSEMATVSKELVRNMEEVRTPRWLSDGVKRDFDSLKKDIRLAGNAMSVACKAGAQMLKSGKLTANDVGIMANHAKEAAVYLQKTRGLLEKFMGGYGLDAAK